MANKKISKNKSFKVIAVFITIIIIILAISLFLKFNKQSSSENTPAIGSKSYVGNSPEECSRIQVLCVSGFERFDDSNGCGCERKA